MSYVIFPIYSKLTEGASEVVAKFKMESRKLISMYEKEIPRNEKFGKTLLVDAPRHTEFREIKRIKAELEDALANETNKEYEDSYYIEVFASGFLLDREKGLLCCVWQRVCTQSG